MTRQSRGHGRAGKGSIKPRAASGHTTISSTRATKDLLERLRKHRKYPSPWHSLDDVIYQLAHDRFEWLDDLPDAPAVEKSMDSSRSA